MDIQEFHGKRILFVCRETYSQPLWFLCNDWKEDNAVATFHIMSSECSYNKCYYNVNTYYRFKEELPGITLYDVRDICAQFIAGMKEKKKTGKSPVGRG